MDERETLIRVEQQLQDSIKKIDKKFINKELIGQISRYKQEIGVLNNKRKC
jgi:hypothetical protein